MGSESSIDGFSSIKHPFSMKSTINHPFIDGFSIVNHPAIGVSRYPIDGNPQIYQKHTKKQLSSQTGLGALKIPQVRIYYTSIMSHTKCLGYVRDICIHTCTYTCISYIYIYDVHVCVYIYIYILYIISCMYAYDHI